jgi:enoyl-CoA hydratase/carnithine racemase
MELEHLLYAADGPIATITLNRPDRLNAITGQSMEEIGEALDRARRDSKVKVIIITGAGRGFCSGGDRKMAADRFGKNPDLVRRPHSQRPFYRAQEIFTTLDRPVIAAVNGPAIGGGMDIALWCDIRIASDRATFGELYIDRGLVPDLGGLYLLPRIVGYAKAAELLLTGDIIDAQTALQIGLVNHVVPHEHLMERCRAIALKMAAKPGRGLYGTKRALARLMVPDWEREADYHFALHELLIQSPDFIEADQAFVQKRAPDFKDNR